MHSTVLAFTRRPEMGPMLPTRQDTDSASPNDPVMVITPPSIVTTSDGSTARTVDASNAGSCISMAIVKFSSASTSLAMSTTSGATYSKDPPMTPLMPTITVSETW